MQPHLSRFGFSNNNHLGWISNPQEIEKIPTNCRLCVPQYHSVWWMRVDIDSVLSSILAYSMDLNEFKLHTVYFGTLEQIKPLQPVGQAAEFKFQFKFEPLQFIWQLRPKAIPEDNGRFRGKINGQALGAALRLRVGESDGRAQT